MCVCVRAWGAGLGSTKARTGLSTQVVRTHARVCPHTRTYTHADIHAGVKHTSRLTPIPIPTHTYPSGFSMLRDRIRHVSVRDMDRSEAEHWLRQSLPKDGVHRWSDADIERVR